MRLFCWFDNFFPVKRDTHWPQTVRCFRWTVDPSLKDRSWLGISSVFRRDLSEHGIWPFPKLTRKAAHNTSRIVSCGLNKNSKIQVTLSLHPTAANLGHSQLTLKHISRISRHGDSTECRLLCGEISVNMQLVRCAKVERMYRYLAELKRPRQNFFHVHVVFRLQQTSILAEVLNNNDERRSLLVLVFKHETGLLRRQQKPDTPRSIFCSRQSDTDPFFFFVFSFLIPPLARPQVGHETNIKAHPANPHRAPMMSFSIPQ